MKTNLFIGIILAVTLSSCNKAKKELTTKIINSYALSVKEQDETTMKKIFPDIVYFAEYPKIDRIVVKEMEVNRDNVMSLCTLYYETGLGKKIEQEIKLLVNTKDSIITNVTGYLERKQRNEIMKSLIFKSFPDLLPKEEDMDVNFVKNEKIGWNRKNGFDYYAQKAIGDRSKVKLEIHYNKYTTYGIFNHYRNVRIDLSITNNSDFNCIYDYIDDNFGPDYSFPAFTVKKDKSYGYQGEINLKPKESISQFFAFKDEYLELIDKDKIKIKPKMDSVELAVQIVNKYYDDKVKKMILSGLTDFWKDSYDYKIESK